jgi:hypothetical protein
VAQLLLAEAEAVHGLRAAVVHGETNRRWLEEAYQRYMEAHELTQRVLEEEVA